MQKEEWRRGDDHFNSLMNAMIFGVCCIGAAFVFAYLDQNGWNWAHWRQTLITIIFAGMGMYKLYWKPSKAVSACRAAGPISSAPVDSTAGSGTGAELVVDAGRAAGRLSPPEPLPPPKVHSMPELKLAKLPASEDHRVRCRDRPPVHLAGGRLWKQDGNDRVQSGENAGPPNLPKSA